MDKRSEFSSKIGFVMAAATSAVGLGNIWRFPYLAAKYGGGLFLIIYLIFVLTLGFAIMTARLAIGRKAQLSPMGYIGPWINASVLWASLPLWWLSDSAPVQCYRGLGNQIFCRFCNWWQHGHHAGADYFRATSPSRWSRLSGSLFLS